MRTAEGGGILMGWHDSGLDLSFDHHWHSDMPHVQCQGQLSPGRGFIPNGEDGGLLSLDQ